MSSILHQHTRAHLTPLHPRPLTSHTAIPTRATRAQVRGAPLPTPRAKLRRTGSAKTLPFPCDGLPLLEPLGHSLTTPLTAACASSPPRSPLPLPQPEFPSPTPSPHPQFLSRARLAHCRGSCLSTPVFLGLAWSTARAPAVLPRPVRRCQIRLSSVSPSRPSVSASTCTTRVPDRPVYALHRLHLNSDDPPPPPPRQTNVADCRDPSRQPESDDPEELSADRRARSPLPLCAWRARPARGARPLPRPSVAL